MYRSWFGSLQKCILNSGVEYNNYICNSHRYQTVRWRRKPRWLPVAKSKMFRVPERKKLPREEYEELKTIWNHYRTEIKSLRHYFYQKLELSTTAPEVIAEIARKEEEDHQKCIELNNHWNLEVGKIREARIAAEKEKEAEDILKTLEVHQQNKAERKVKIETMVREEKEKSKHFITAENIDIAIEASFSDTKDFNFAIDVQGNIYHGRDSRPADKPSGSDLKNEPARSAAASG